MRTETSTDIMHRTFLVWLQWHPLHKSLTEDAFADFATELMALANEYNSTLAVTEAVQGEDRQMKTNDTIETTIITRDGNVELKTTSKKEFALYCLRYDGRTCHVKQFFDSDGNHQSWDLMAQTSQIMSHTAYTHIFGEDQLTEDEAFALLLVEAYDEGDAHLVDRLSDDHAVETESSLIGAIDQLEGDQEDATYFIKMLAELTR